MRFPNKMKALNRRPLSTAVVGISNAFGGIDPSLSAKGVP